MSYDIGVGDCDLNYTYNLAQLFYDHIPAEDGKHKGGLHALAGLTGKQAVEVLRPAFERLNETICSKGTDCFRNTYDAPNGWGSTDGALIFLARLLAGCAANPRKRIWLC